MTANGMLAGRNNEKEHWENHHLECMTVSLVATVSRETVCWEGICLFSRY